MKIVDDALAVFHQRDFLDDAKPNADAHYYAARPIISHMASKRTTNAKTSSDIKEPNRNSRWLWVLVCTTLGLLLVIAIADYNSSQNPAHSTRGVEPNAIGIIGTYVARALLHWVGGAAWLIPTFLFWLAWLHLKKCHTINGILFITMFAAIHALAVLLAEQYYFFTDVTLYEQGADGLVGSLIYKDFLRIYLGTIGSMLIMGAIYVASLVYIFTLNTNFSFDSLKERFREWRERRFALNQERKEAKQLAKAEALAAKQELKADREAAKQLAKSETEIETPIKKSKLKKLKKEAAAEPTPEPTATTEAVEEPVKKLPSLKEALKIVAPEETKKARIKLPVSHGDYIFPTLDLLSEEKKPENNNSEEEHALNAERLQQTLKEFNVEVTLGEIHIGPVITRYEVYPAPGVRVEKISSLDKNIALGMRAQSVRILAPVPGKGCVGIEVPNAVPAPVGIREILESEDWAKSKAEIPIALGRDVSGKPIISDLTKMPHLLIAGTTGAGKTVCINAIITSLLFHSSPENLRFIMVDPKIVEMKIFNSLPHMLIPVVTDPKKVPGALKWLLNEMEHRYQIFAKEGVRNIAGFNGRKKPEKEKSEDEKIETQLQDELDIAVPRDEGVLDETPDKLPYIVCIVDELADLMMVAPADIETGIARLAQLARAAGIHLVLATQRPSVNVITGVIKANLPCRISFQVSSKIDSRTILDGSGAEQLIGRGDMLFSPPGSSQLIRSQGAFVSDEEIASIVQFLENNGPPKFAEDVQRQIEQPDNPDLDNASSDGDELFPQALDVLRATKRASTSMLQRRLKIGYNRAARLMEELEDRGIVGPENGSSPREILVDLDIT